MKKHLSTLVLASVCFVPMQGNAGESCDTGVAGCSVTCSQGDWCIAVWVEPDGPCVTRCPSGNVAAVMGTMSKMTPVDSTKNVTIDVHNVPASELQTILSGGK